MCKENLTTLQQLGGIRNIYLHHLFTNLFRFWKVSGQLREKGDWVGYCKSCKVGVLLKQILQDIGQLDGAIEDS